MKILIAKDIRYLTEPMGCWPLKCHGCNQYIGEDEEICFARVDYKGVTYLPTVHPACVGKPVKYPTKKQLKAKAEYKRTGVPMAYKTGGGYLTLDEVTRL